VYICTRHSLRCCQNTIFPTPSLFTFCIRSWEGTRLPQRSVYVLRCFAMWNSSKRIPFPEFNYNSLNISTAETVYEMHVGVLIPVSLIWNKKFWEEIIAYFPLIRHGPHWKRRVQQFFYCCVCICYRGNGYTEPLPSSDRGIYTTPLPSNDRGIHIQTNTLMGGIF
jgi:hypothetical protein